MDKKILRTLAVLTVGFGLNALTQNNASAGMTYTGMPVETGGRYHGHPPRYHPHCKYALPTRATIATDHDYQYQQTTLPI